MATPTSEEHRDGREMANDDNDPLPQIAAQFTLYIIPLVRQISQEASNLLSSTQASVLGTIYRHGPLQISDVAARERLSVPTVSRTIASLVDAGLVKRSYDDDDRRRCRVKVTKAGLETIGEHRATRNAWLAKRLSQLDGADMATVEAMLRVLPKLTDEWREVDPWVIDKALEQDGAEGDDQGEAEGRGRSPRRGAR